MRRGITLVELLVVIGIIGLLLGILLPTLAAARSRARQVACAAQLRQSGAALMTQSLDHEGFMQMACEVALLPGALGRPLPPQVNDARERRYLYGPRRGVIDGFFPRHLASLQDSLLPYLPPEMFLCPDDDQGHQGDAAPRVSTTYVVGNVRYITGDAYTYSSYAANASVFGFTHDDALSPHRVGGNVSRIADASNRVLLADCDPATAEATFWSARLDLTDEVALDDVVTNPSNLAYLVGLDDDRHRSRLNSLMADGHVETSPVPKPSMPTGSRSTLLQRRVGG